MGYKHIKGADKLERKLLALADEVKKEIRVAIQESAQEVADTQKRLAPIGRTGKLRKSITWTWGNQDLPAYAALKGGAVKGDPELSVIITAGNSEVRYAHLVEFGTAPHPQGGMFAGTMHPGTRPQPFFFPGYRIVKKRVKGRVTRAANKALKRVAKS